MDDTRVIGVFDTVGSLGLPGELTVRSNKLRTIFGFPDHLLGHHVERAYHAMAINETRKDFVSMVRRNIVFVLSLFL